MSKFETEFIFDTFDEAMNVHKELFKLLRECGYISYQTLYFYIYKKTDVRKGAENYGWTNLWYSKVQPYGTDGQWVLKLPELENLSKKLKEKENKNNEN